MAGSEQAKKLAETAEDRLDKVAHTMRQKFDELTGGRLVDQVDQVDKGQDQARQRAEEQRGDGSDR